MYIRFDDEELYCTLSLFLISSVWFGLIPFFVMYICVAIYGFFLLATVWFCVLFSLLLMDVLSETVAITVYYKIGVTLTFDS